MSIVLALSQLVSIIVIIIYEFKRKFLSIFLWATLLIMFGIPHFLSEILRQSKYDNDTMIQASIFVTLFNLVYLFIRIFLSKSRFKKKYSQIKKKEYIVNDYIDNRISRYLFAILCVSMVVFGIVVFINFGSILNVSWGGLYVLNRDTGIWNPLRYIYFIFFASAGVCLVFKENKSKLLFIISVVLILFYGLLSGNRTNILPLLLVFIIPLVFKSEKRFSIKAIVGLSLLGAFSVYLVYFIKLNRIYGGFYATLSSIDFSTMNVLVLDMILNGEGELGLRNAFYHFIDNNNQFPNFNEGHTYRRLLFIAIPTSLSFGLKPPDFAISMGSAWINDFSNNNYSMHPTLYGDVFGNFWWLGIFMGIYWAIFAYVIDKIVDRRNPSIKNVLLVLGGSMYIIIARGSIYNAVFIAFISCLLIFGVYFLSKLRFEK
ncbi:O-antigen polymerase [Lederbergia citrea]|uniref:Oligosaccharide repeat unit polymerase n=1 Tax=Lederbergia citrea TaxID=2833581 RepID=A0A942Z394_9BACI|nr:O-antigen polymerase [Lederbergia citrea]MBS4223348.1 oligosaccharide repeat unit polymerase [Lederbergia citrea]